MKISLWLGLPVWSKAIKFVLDACFKWKVFVLEIKTALTKKAGKISNNIDPK